MYIKAVSKNRNKIKSSHLKNVNNDFFIPFNIQLVSTFPQLSYNFCLLLSSVQFSRVQLIATPWTAARQASVSITNSQSLLIFMSTESVMPSNHLILCRPLLLLPPIPPLNGLPFPIPGDLPNPGIELASPALAGICFTTESPETPQQLWWGPQK